MKEMVKKWYALYTKPRTEKKAYSNLIRKGIESWCPVQKIQRQWSDRKKIIEDPLFKSYVFVRINDAERLAVLQTDGIINFVHHSGKPAVIRDEEIETVKAYLKEESVHITTQSLESINEEIKVKIKSGVFMDNTGTVVRGGKKKVYVRLESLGQMLTVEFPIEDVKPVKQ